jgi:alanine racemase
MARIGISMYGLWPSEKTERLAKAQKIPFNLKPAFSWYARIVQIKTLPKNTCVGYGCTYKTKKKTKVAILPLGYYEGYDRHLSKKGEVLIRGQRCKLLGRVCMNLTIVDVTRISNVRVGDRVVLIGKDKKEEITAEEVAEKIGTINYEVVSRINPNIPRIYKI